MSKKDSAFNIQIKFVTRSLLIYIIFMLLACEPTRYNEHSEILLDDTPSTYREGYSDGCGSGRNAAGDYMIRYTRSEAYLNDYLYTRGWDEGYKDCKEQLEEDLELEDMMRY